MRADNRPLHHAERACSKDQPDEHQAGEESGGEDLRARFAGPPPHEARRRVAETQPNGEQDVNRKVDPQHL